MCQCKIKFAEFKSKKPPKRSDVTRHSATTTTVNRWLDKQSPKDIKFRLPIFFFEKLCLCNKVAPSSFISEVPVSSLSFRTSYRLMHAIQCANCVNIFSLAKTRSPKSSHTHSQKKKKIRFNQFWGISACVVLRQRR